MSNIITLPGSFSRISSAPLERESVFKTLSDLQTYASTNPIAFPGQICAVSGTDTVYVIKGNMTPGSIGLNPPVTVQGTTTEPTIRIIQNGSGPGLTISGSLSTNNNITVQSVTVPVSVLSLTTDRTFVASDTNNIFHFDTTSGNKTATFPAGLPSGFNVAIMNTGTNQLIISAPSYSALGNILNDQYAAAFVYKQGSTVYAVGGV